MFVGPRTVPYRVDEELWRPLEVQAHAAGLEEAEALEAGHHKRRRGRELPVVPRAEEGRELPGH